MTNGLAISYMQQSRYADAEALLAPAVPLAERTFGSNHPRTLNMLSSLGGAIRQQPGRNAEARPYYEKAFKTALALYGADSRRVVFAEMNLAELLRDDGQLDDAERHARNAVVHMDRAVGKKSVYRGMLFERLASILIRQHNYTEAEPVLAKAYAVLSNAPGFGPSHPETQAVIRDCVDLYTRWKRPKAAAQWQARLAPSAKLSTS